MTRLAASQARTEFSDVLNRVAYRGERIVLHRRGKDVAALVPMEAYARLERAIQASEDKADRAAIRQAKRDIAKHGTVPWEEVKKRLER
jgi:prevent-host-death family protein